MKPKTFYAVIIAIIFMLTSVAGPAWSRHAKGSSGGSHHSSSYKSHGHNKKYSSVAKRDRHGRIARSARDKNEFKKSHPCPSTGKSSGSCPGYVIDHVTPLKRGGADAPHNMQWQTKADAKAKDRWE